MDREARRELASAVDEVTRWVGRAGRIHETRRGVERAATEAAGAFADRSVPLSDSTEELWRVIPLSDKDEPRLARLAAQHHHRPLAPDNERLLALLLDGGPDAVKQVKAMFGLRKVFSGNQRREAAQRASAVIMDLHRRISASSLPDDMARIERAVPGPTRLPVAEALDDHVGFGPRLRQEGRYPILLGGDAVSIVRRELPALLSTLGRVDALRDQALASGNALRHAETAALLSDMPVDRLREATRDRLRVSPLADAGITTVAQVLLREQILDSIPGIGAASATKIRGAAHTLRKTTFDEMPVRIDIAKRTREAGILLQRLQEWDTARKLIGSRDFAVALRAMQHLPTAVGRQTSHLVVLSTSRPSPEFRDALTDVAATARQLGRFEGGERPATWDDFMNRPADYFALLAELGFVSEDEEKVAGQLPQEIVDAIRAQELDIQHLKANLRGYQSFGARFAIVQRHVVIGDEMGLGKTIEALATLAHLRAKGAHHFIVVCPAAVVTNWCREVHAKSSLTPHRVHGAGRDAAAANWLRSGGVAVTTFETLRAFEPLASRAAHLGCVVVDEAHYIKNPGAMRSQRTAALLARADRSILLTGTPLENRLDEFRSLISYIRADLAVDADELSPARFRRQVAPVYLRRNQEDVLTELPELIEVDEVIPMSAADAGSYREAVGRGNFMAMRQAAMLQGRQSSKLERLIDLVREAEENGRRVIVFSYFRTVLEAVAGALPGRVFGPLTGSVPASKRQLMVDDFSKSPGGAVLVAQIEAGGVGLNIQAASVIIICEPQLKPTSEWQAIARSRRMGQLEAVQVHRLLSEDGVDQRVRDILSRKRQLFEEFARASLTADSAPEAYDVSESELVQEVIAQERRRLFR